ncbi:hypothetical protein GGI35DRAFT_443290 [Trichoderma velutinum]
MPQCLRTPMSCKTNGTIRHRPCANRYLLIDTYVGRAVALAFAVLCCAVLSYPGRVNSSPGTSQQPNVAAGSWLQEPVQVHAVAKVSG